MSGGNWEEAKKLCEEAHEIDPESASPPIAGCSLLDNGAMSTWRISRSKGEAEEARSVAADTLGWPTTN